MVAAERTLKAMIHELEFQTEIISLKQFSKNYLIAINLLIDQRFTVVYRTSQGFTPFFVKNGEVHIPSEKNDGISLLIIFTLFLYWFGDVLSSDVPVLLDQMDQRYGTTFKEDWFRICPTQSPNVRS